MNITNSTTDSTIVSSSSSFLSYFNPYSYFDLKFTFHNPITKTFLENLNFFSISFIGNFLHNCKFRLVGIILELFIQQFDNFRITRQLSFTTKTRAIIRLTAIVLVSFQLLYIIGILLLINETVYEYVSSFTFISKDTLSYLFNLKSLHFIPMPYISYELRPSDETHPLTGIIRMSNYIFNVNNLKGPLDYEWFTKRLNWGHVDTDVANSVIKEEIIWDSFIIICISYMVEEIDCLFLQKDGYKEIGCSPYFIAIFFFDGQINPANKRLLFDISDYLLFIICYFTSQIIMHIQSFFKIYNYRLLVSTIIFGSFMLFEIQKAALYGAEQATSSVDLMLVTYPVVLLFFCILCAAIYLFASLIAGGPSKMITPFGDFKLEYTGSLHYNILLLCKTIVSPGASDTFSLEDITINAPIRTWIENNEINIDEEYPSRKISIFQNVPKYSSISIMISVIEYILTILKGFKRLLLPSKPIQLEPIPFNEENFEEEEDEEYTLEAESESESESESDLPSETSHPSSTNEELRQLLFPNPSTLPTLVSSNNHHSILTRHLFNPQNKPLTRSSYKQVIEKDRRESLQLIENSWKNPTTNPTIDIDSLPPSSICVVCMSAQREIILWPCGCLLMCEECRETLASQLFSGCISCRRKVTSYSQINTSPSPPFST